MGNNPVEASTTTCRASTNCYPEEKLPFPPPAQTASPHANPIHAAFKNTYWVKCYYCTYDCSSP